MSFVAPELRVWILALTGLAGAGIASPADLVLETVSAPFGNAVALQVRVLDRSGPSAAIQFDLEHPPWLGLAGSPGPAVSDSGKTLYSRTLGAGRTRYLIVGRDSTPIPEGVLVSLAGTVGADTQPGNYSLAVRDGTGSDPGGEDSPVSGSETTLTVGGSVVTVNKDLTSPTIAISSPAAGATVSNTVTITATATDNIGVAGVQFRLNGANLGTEISASSYSLSWDTKTVANGTYFLTAVARDAAGNSATATTIGVTVNNIPSDRQNPVVTITSPTSGTSVSATLTVTATATDNTGVVGVQFKLNGLNLGAEKTSPPYMVSWDTTTVSNGAYTVVAVARDAAGNIGVSPSVQLNVSNIPADFISPSITLVMPDNGQLISGVVSINAHATDNVEVVGVQFQLDGVNLGPEKRSIPFSMGWTTTDYQNGPHVLTAVARDTAGNVAVSPQLSVIIANIPASGTYVFPLGQDRSTKGNWKNVYGQDGNYIVQHSALVPSYSEFNPSGANSALLDSYAADPRAPWKYNFSFQPTERIMSQFFSQFSFDLTVSSTDNQSHRIALYFCDWERLGRSVKVSVLDSVTRSVLHMQQLASYGDGLYLVYNYRGRITFRIENLNSSTVGNPNATLSSIFWGGSGIPAQGSADSNPPSVSIVSPIPQAIVSGFTTLSANASDDVGVVGVQYKLDGVNLGPDATTAPYSYAWNTVVASNGNHILTAVARDAAGNATTSAAVTVNVSNPVPDTTNPVVGFTTPLAGASLSGTVNLSVRATDNVGVVGVQFKLNGANLGSEKISSPYTIAWNTTTVSNGQYTLSAIARDAVGNSGVSTPLLVTINNPWLDTTNPRVNFTAPASGATLTGVVSLAVNATDNVDVVGVQFRLNGVSFGAEKTSAAFTIDWDTTTAVNGAHTLSAVARDAAGNTSVGQVSVSVNNVVAPPSPGGGNGVVFKFADTTTKGSWRGVYGQDGNYIVQHSTAVPSYAAFTPSAVNLYVKDTYSTDIRALQKQFYAFRTTERIESYMHIIDSMTFDVSASDGKSHRIALYFCDYERLGRAITAEARDGITGAVLDSRLLSDYKEGVYLVYAYSGRIRFRVSNNNPVPAAATASISAIFWGGSTN